SDCGAAVTGVAVRGAAGGADVVVGALVGGTEDVDVVGGGVDVVVVPKEWATLGRDCDAGDRLAALAATQPANANAAMATATRATLRPGTEPLASLRRCARRPPLWSEPVLARAPAVAAVAVTAALGGLLAGCSTASPRAGRPRAMTRADAAATTSAPTSPTNATTTSTPSPDSPMATPPSTTAVEPAFVGTVSDITAADVPSTWRPGCPVSPSDLRLLHLSYWGFDDQSHVGTMVVNASVVPAVLSVFGRLYGERFPIRKMQPEDAYGGSDPASMADDNTSGFNCRYAVAPGPPSWSIHAYGEAIDVNPVENPYQEGSGWQPAAGAAYADRADVRAGMAEPGGPLVAAFAAAGWQWGGRWTGSPDYQHFSSTGG
ncbi:MAG TPA: M15 family metallopeptidase, partial [Acidimicrobiales bacterium]|nr:M15 family metallopeptidase [Acidimicrobiales bacterium]